MLEVSTNPQPASKNNSRAPIQHLDIRSGPIPVFHRNSQPRPELLQDPPEPLEVFFDAPRIGDGARRERLDPLRAQLGTPKMQPADQRTQNLGEAQHRLGS